MKVQQLGNRIYKEQIIDLPFHVFPSNIFHTHRLFLTQLWSYTFPYFASFSPNTIIFPCYKFSLSGTFKGYMIFFQVILINNKSLYLLGIYYVPSPILSALYVCVHLIITEIYKISAIIMSTLRVKTSQQSSRLRMSGTHVLIHYIPLPFLERTIPLWPETWLYHHLFSFLFFFFF